MKIGVFGDSFADSNTSKSIWWKYLAEQYQHDVECFGESGSSLVFSATKLLNSYQNYDLVIWCATSSNRLTIWHRANFKEIPVHVTGRHHKTYSDPEIQEKINIAEQYINHVFDWPEGEFVGHCVVNTVQSIIPNLLIIPSFTTPIYYKKDAGFNLYDLCSRETKTYFPNGKEIADIMDEYHDTRAGHFTAETHQTLAKLVSQSLRPGIFSTKYENFSPPVESFENIFLKL
jgi:hypothetical protein